MRARAGRALVLVGLLLGLSVGVRPERATAGHGSATAGAAAPRFGLAHVDLMDLHLERRPDGVVRAEVLPPADLAERYTLAVGSGAAWNRWSLYWDLVERDGRRDWSVPDAIVARDVAAGLRTLAILQGTPPGQATGGTSTAAVPEVGGKVGPALQTLRVQQAVAPQSSPPRGLDQPIFRAADGRLTDDPAGAADTNPGNPFARFVDAAVQRYRPGGSLAVERGWSDEAGVRAWEVGNEPNLRHFWSGSAAQFARYLEVAYLVITWRDPDATVVHGGIADDSSARTWYRAFLDALTARAAQSPLPARHSYYFDAAGWHWYTYPSLLNTGPPAARALLEDAGLPAKPIWVTETGVPVWSEHPGPCWDPTSPWRATAAEQAGYVWQALTEAVASRVAVLIHFQTYDDCGNGPTSYDAFGLIRNPPSNQCWRPPEGQPCWGMDPALAGVPRPAYEAYQTAVSELGDAELLWRPPRDAAFWQRVLLYRPPDTRVTVLWNWLRREQTVEVNATGPDGVVLTLDEDGNVGRTAVAPSGGRHAVTLPGTTNRNNPGNQGPVMAGRPVMLVERDTLPPFRAEVRPLPPTSTAALTLTAAAADGGTGVGAYRLLVTTERPTRPEDWPADGQTREWPAAPLGGEVTLSFTGTVGARYYFALQARDRAGNWSAPPAQPQAETRVVGPDAPTGTPTATAVGGATPSATPSSGARPSATATVAPTVGVSATPTAAPSAAVGTPTSTATSTPGAGPTTTPTPRPTRASSATATDGPPLRRAYLPLLLGDVTRAAGGWRVRPLCEALEVAVRGPRGTRLDENGRAGQWWLRAVGGPYGAGRVLEAPLGAPICIAPEAERRTAWAEVAGYVTFPPQDLALSDTLHLAVTPNALANGTFEAGLAGWIPSGSTPPQVTVDALSGARAALLGADFVGQPELGGGGNSTLAQDVRLSAERPTLSLVYRFDSRPTCGPEGCAPRDRFEVLVVDLERAGWPATYLTPRRGLRAAADRWTHLWYDLAPWAGRQVRVVLNLYQPDAVDPSRLWLDNVAVGPAAPDGGGF